MASKVLGLQAVRGISSMTAKNNARHLVTTILQEFNKPKTNSFPYSFLSHIIATQKEIEIFKKLNNGQWTITFS